MATITNWSIFLKITCILVLAIVLMYSKSKVAVTQGLKCDVRFLFNNCRLHLWEASNGKFSVVCEMLEMDTW